MKLRVLAAVASLSLAPVAEAQTVSESWLRLAASVCGGETLDLNADVEGNFSSLLLKRLSAVEGEAQATYNFSSVEALLDQFEKEDRSDEARAYRECLLTLVNSAVASSGLPPREVKLDSPVAVAKLDTVRRGQQFVMVPGDAVAVKNLATIFTLDSMRSLNKKPRVSFTWSNSETGEGKSASQYQGAIISLGTDCRLVPFKIDLESSQASFISNC
ncbi:MAG: hypothetical protein AAFU72_08715 [Pseudomonadota bacterium]